MANINDVGMPFTSVSGDRKYSSAEFRRYFSMLVDTGIIGNIRDEFEVEQQSVPNKTLKVKTGAVLIEGAVLDMDEVQNVSFADNTSGNTRIDRIVLRLNLVDRKIEVVVLEGTPAGSPAAPTLTRNDSIYELSIAKVAVANGFSALTNANITDERLDESVCGYFKYKAKPAWYPESGVVPIDAWIYTNFKDNLTPAEIADIEANQSLRDIIINSNIYNTRNMIYNSLLGNVSRISEFTVNSADLVYSSNDTFPSRLVVVDNLTINSGVVVETFGKTQVIVVKNLLTLNGDISATDRVPAVISGSRTAGSTAGGGVVILANRIQGNGRIISNGGDGIGYYGSGAASGADGTDGLFGEYVINGGDGVDSSAPRVPGIWSSPILTNMIPTLYKVLITDLIYSSGGGAPVKTLSSYGNGASGGSSIFGLGGRGSSAVQTESSQYTAGAGGGAGGIIMIFSESALPAIEIIANGGNASEPDTINCGKGGGGGGGTVYLCSPDSSLVSTSLLGGLKSVTGYDDGGATDGGNGVVISYDYKNTIG